MSNTRTIEVIPTIPNTGIETPEFLKQLEESNVIWDMVFCKSLDLDTILKECYGIYHCINDESVVIACCYFQIKQHPDTHEDVLFIYGLATLPDYRNQGAGSSIIYSIIKIYGPKYPIVLFVDKPDNSILEGTIDGPWEDHELQEIIEMLKEETEQVRKLVQFYINRGFYELPGTDFRRFHQFGVYGLQYDHPKK